MHPNSRASLATLQTVQSLKENLDMKNWSSVSTSLKRATQSYINSDVIELFHECYLQGEYIDLLQRTMKELDALIEISNCSSRFEIANTIASYFVKISVISEEISSLKKKEKVTFDSDTKYNKYFPSDLLRVISWTSAMRLAILSEDWSKMESCIALWTGNSITFSKYSPIGGSVCICHKYLLFGFVLMILDEFYYILIKLIFHYLN
jgi:hypothetical protein